MRSSIIAISFCLSVSAFAGPREQAVTLHKRLTGVQPSAATLDQMASLISQGRTKEAAQIATTSRYFYDITVKSWAAPMTNIDQNPVVPLNDSVATVIGLVRDNIPFTNVLTGDLIYLGDATTNASISPYDISINGAKNHFASIETLNANSDQPIVSTLKQQVQSTITGVSDTAGIITTEAYGEAWIQAGTNRRVFQSLVRNFWCSEMDGIHDTSIPGIRIRRDVTRVPGGSSALFQNKCLGCHGTMDAAIGGTAYFDFGNNGIKYTPGQVNGKMNRNSQEYPDGYVTTDDSWMFLGGYSATNSFGKIGWRGATSGNGLHSFATAFAVSRGFSDCMAKRVFRKVCVRDATPADEPTIQMLADKFENQGNYNLKSLFEDTAILCME